MKHGIMSECEVDHSSDADWWRSFHIPEMADLFLVREEQDLRATVEFLISRLALDQRARVYDQCCGIGSLSIALASDGVRVTGADLCESYIRRAEDDAKRANADCEFVCADAFLFVPEVPCDAVFNWYSSFGYADSDDRNRQMLVRAFAALRPEGRFAMDIPNLPALLRRFEPRLVRRGESAGRQVTLVRDCELDLQRGTLKQLWNWSVEGQQPITRRSSLRLYLPHQVRRMLEQSGFENVQMLGSVAGEDLTMDSQRLICLATRPAI